MMTLQLRDWLLPTVVAVFSTSCAIPADESQTKRESAIAEPTAANKTSTKKVQPPVFQGPPRDDPLVEIKGFPASEYFYKNGYWAASIQATILTSVEGRWQENSEGRVCVVVERSSAPNAQYPEQICRAKPYGRDGFLMFRNLFGNGVGQVNVKGSFD